MGMHTRYLGRASDWQAEGQRFDPIRLHHNQKTALNVSLWLFFRMFQNFSLGVDNLGALDFFRKGFPNKKNSRMDSTPFCIVLLMESILSVLTRRILWAQYLFIRKAFTQHTNIPFSTSSVTTGQW